MVVLAAGGIIWRGTQRSGVEVLLVHRPRYHDWTFPKGKLHKGESLLAAALREVEEETGLSVVVGHRMPVVRYRTLDGPKEVTYWAMRPDGGEFSVNSEVDKIRWVSLGAARRKLTYTHDRRLADGLTDLPPSVVRVVLVRHADAGRRRDFDGPDLGRPLSDRGQAQAAALVALLRSFGPTRLVSAPALRCIQTIEPLARVRGLIVEQAGVFGEEEFGTDPHAATLRLRSAMQAAEDVTVICSQGGVIPALMTLLSPAGEPEPSPQIAAKAGVWTLAVGAGPVRTDYYPPTKN